MPLRCAFNEGEEEIELGAPGWIRQQSVCVRMCAYVCVCVCVWWRVAEKERESKNESELNKYVT